MPVRSSEQSQREKLIGEQFCHGVGAGQIAKQPDAMYLLLALGQGFEWPDQRKNEDKNDLWHAHKCRRCSPLRSLTHAILLVFGTPSTREGPAVLATLNDVCLRPRGVPIRGRPRE